MLRFVPVPQTGIAQPEADKQAIGCTYYNLTGVASSEPFDGVNIVVTRYSDGTTTATKVIR